MAGRSSLDDKLAALRALRGEDLDDARKAEVRKRIGDRSNFVVAAAAALAGENGLLAVAPDLEAAYERFMADPTRDDKGCRAKLAIVEALDKMECPESALFLKASTHVQMEPVWGGSEDTAAPLRAAALVGLTRVEGTLCLPSLVDALTDPTRDVRAAAAVCLGALGTETAGLILRLKVRLGDKDPDVLSECLGGLLKVSPREYLPTVAGFLRPTDESTCEAAALALGRSRLPDALAPLRSCWERCVQAGLKSQILLAVAILRQKDANDWLIGLVSGGSAADATAALTALRINRGDSRLSEAIAEAARSNGSPTVRNAYDREFT